MFEGYIRADVPDSLFIISNALNELLLTFVLKGLRFKATARRSMIHNCGQVASRQVANTKIMFFNSVGFPFTPSILRHLVSPIRKLRNCSLDVGYWDTCGRGPGYQGMPSYY